MISLLIVLILNIALAHQKFNNDHSNHIKDDDGDEFVTLYSSCNEIDQNGLYYIKPMGEEGGILPVICNDGYTMIDGSLDLDLNILPQFLSSWDQGQWSLGRIISNLDDLSTFREWWLPADENTKFRVANDCEQCIDGQFGDNTVYYTDSHPYCVSKDMEVGCIDDTTDWYYHPESCNQCDSAINVDQYGRWSVCYAVHLESDHPIDHDHTQCVARGLTFHPTISYNRDSCTCYQPQESEPISYQVLVSDLPTITWKEYDVQRHGIDYYSPNIKFAPDDDDDDVDGNIDNTETNIVYLYNDDFIGGTYRIRESGTYIIMEDIIFNFNPPSEETMSSPDFSPNSIDDDEIYWNPTREQAVPNGEYPGLHNYQGPYTLGFFAGITVECDNVVIDLNGYTLSQDPIYYFQQRHFMLISLASSPFLPGQGTANWGFNISSPSYVEIRDGNLGLSSHHGIHGLSADYVTISNLNVYNYDVAGIQCNGCNYVELSDCTVGPQNKNIPTLGRYTQARTFLPRLKQLVDEFGDESITFYDREPLTVDSIVYRLINQMDMIYFHFINGEEYDEDDTEWIAAKKLFYNPSGWMDGGTSYGVAFGGQGSQVIGIGSRPTKTANIAINNLEIYGIGNQLNEKIKFVGEYGATRLMFFDAIDLVDVSSQVDDLSTSKYIGDAYTDCVFTIYKLIDSWYYLNSLYVLDAEATYVFDGDSEGFEQQVFGQEENACGTDIQTHSSKGAIGLRIDGVQQLSIDGVYIHDIANWADLGNNKWCGQYTWFHAVDEDYDIQYGYPGTRSHGFIIDYAQGEIKNIQIDGIESYHGEANGFTIYKGCNLTLGGYIKVDNIYAGSQLTDNDVLSLTAPNLIPRACGVDIRDDTIVNINTNQQEGDGIIIGDNINGAETCYDDNNNDDDELVNNEKSKGLFANNGHLWMTIAIPIIGAIGCICIAIIARLNKKQKEYNKSETSTNETTPLLI